MKLPNCKGCGLPVLELDGQFEKLDSYVVEPGGPPVESAGYWHTSCLRASTVGARWCAALLANYRHRGYTEIAAPTGWHVLRDAQSIETFALADDGTSVSLDRHPVLRGVDGGTVHARVEPSFRLVAARESIRAAQDALRATGEYDLLTLLDDLGIRERMDRPEALAGARLVAGAPHQSRWTPTTLVAQLEYGVFVPETLAPYLVSRR